MRVCVLRGYHSLKKNKVAFWEIRRFGKRGIALDNALPDVREGIKTFFVVPDLSIFPEECLKSFCLHGYEAYFIHDDPYCPLISKIHLLISAFSETILFFNIDRAVPGIEWTSFIRKVQRTYGARVRIGVMFQKLNSAEETRRLERLYLYDIGITCGCIPLEYQRNKNLPLFLSVLAANKANGQRKFLRAVCSDAFRISLGYKGRPYRSTIRDISLSHFSCAFPDSPPDIQLMEKVYDVQMNLRGTLCTVDAVLCLKRDTEQEPIHVFVFRNSQDRDGLDYEQQERVNTVVFNYFSNGVNEFLHKLFDAERLRVALARGQAPSSGGEEQTLESLHLDVNKLLESVT